MLEKIQAPAWIEIDAGAIVHNLQEIKRNINDRVDILAVVKADAYGCGAEEVAHILTDSGVKMLGVTSLEEGVNLRRAGITSPILLFAPLLPEFMEEALRNDLTISIGSLAELKSLIKTADRLGKKAVFHLKIETGMGRTGFFIDDLSAVVEYLKNRGICELEGIYTHFAKAGNASYTRRQFAIFKKSLDFLKINGVNVKLKHCANSTAAVLYPEMQLDMVRIGTLLYGQKPYVLKKNLDLRNPWTAYAKILAIRSIPKGHYIGYGGEFRTRRESKIGVIPVGFADGYATIPNTGPKSISDLLKKIVKDVLAYLGKGPDAHCVYLDGQRIPVVGRIGMQLSMIDLTDLTDVKIGDKVKVALRRINASFKLPRLYSREGKIYKERYPESKERMYGEVMDHV